VSVIDVWLSCCIGSSIISTSVCLALRCWLKRARKNAPTPVVRRGRFGGLTALYLEPKFGDERM
jgi:hypothetical protein